MPLSSVEVVGVRNRFIGGESSNLDYDTPVYEMTVGNLGSGSYIVRAWVDAGTSSALESSQVVLDDKNQERKVVLRSTSIGKLELVVLESTGKPAKYYAVSVDRKGGPECRLSTDQNGKLTTRLAVGWWTLEIKDPATRVVRHTRRIEIKASEQREVRVKLAPRVPGD